MKSESFKDTLNQIATESKLSPTRLYMLSRMNQAYLEIFSHTWPTIPTQRRRAIIQELLEIVEVNFEVNFDPVFLLALGDEDSEVRAGAIKSLWEYENPNLIGPLIHLLKTDEAVTVREAAASALGKFIYLRELEEIDWHEANLAEEALRETIHEASEDLNVRRRAVESIAYSSSPDIPQIIENAYYHDNERMQVSAIFAMGRSADSRWLGQALAELDNPSAEIRFEAVRACGELEAQQAVDKLVSFIDEENDQEIMEMAIWALGRIGGQTAKEVLEACLDSQNAALRLAAEDALDELNLFDADLMLYDFEDDDFEEADDFEDFIYLDDINHANGHSKQEDY